MAIKLPNLDDRTFEDIVKQARSLINRYCPEWTDHNESDPGITLIQLFAWMTEMIIYRLNRVPDKNYLAFLELLGLSRKPPEPAKTLLTFTTGAKTTGFVPKGSEIASTIAVNGEQIFFRIEDDLRVFPANLNKVVGLYFDPALKDFQRIDYTLSLIGEDKKGQVPLFQGHDRLERHLYMGSPMLKSVRGGIAVKLEFSLRSEEDRWFFDAISWEYWNGQEWKKAVHFVSYEPEPKPVVTIILHEITGCKDKLLRIEEKDVEQSWIRGVIEPHYFDQDLRLIQTSSSVQTTAYGVVPDRLFSYSGEGDIYTPVDSMDVFTPFTDVPQERNVFYCGCMMLGLVKGLKISINFQRTQDVPSVSEDLQLAWEYWNGEKWIEIGTASPKGTSKGGFDFEDKTRALTETGAVLFVLPNDIAPLIIEDEENFWIRARIVKGNYGVPGHFVEKDGKREWVEIPIRPPYFSHIDMKVEDKDQRPLELTQVIVFDNFYYRDITKEIKKKNGALFFEADTDRYPAFYFGFYVNFIREQREIPEIVQVYIAMEEGVSRPVDKVYGSESFQAPYWLQTESPSGVNIIWEYWNGEVWESLQVEMDETFNFQLSGLMRFQAPRNFKPRTLFQSQDSPSDECYWIRVRWISGSFERPPRVRDIRLNTVWAANVRTVEEEWPSNGEANQTLFTKKRPVYLERNEEIISGRLVETPQNFNLYVSEPDSPEKDEGEHAGFSKWQMVDTFLHSNSNDPHFILDVETGEIRFGDGMKGRVPLAGQRIKASYEWCHGQAGNVPAETVTQLIQPVSGVEVTNLDAAQGGREQETLDELKVRGSMVLKHRYRAVTREDFETLAREASSNVHSAKCVPTAEPGTVELIILPKEISLNEELGKIYPTETLLRKVYRYIDKRRLLTIRLSVKGPEYVGLGILVKVKMKAGFTKKEVQPEIERFLKEYFDPLRGGEDGKGWPMGRDIYVYEIAHQVRLSLKVAYVTDVKIFDSDKNIIPRETGKLILHRNQLPYLYEVKVEEYQVEE
ncbi:MAG: putative baseplate assembly protein [bacterium]